MGWGGPQAHITPLSPVSQNTAARSAAAPDLHPDILHADHDLHHLHHAHLVPLGVEQQHGNPICS